MDPDEGTDYQEADLSLPRFETTFTVGVRAPTLADAAEVEESIMHALVARDDVSDVKSRQDDEPSDA